jgi:hypothetical protein
VLYGLGGKPNRNKALPASRGQAIDAPGNPVIIRAVAGEAVGPGKAGGIVGIEEVGIVHETIVISAPCPKPGLQFLMGYNPLGDEEEQGIDIIDLPVGDVGNVGMIEIIEICHVDRPFVFVPFPANFYILTQVGPLSHKGTNFFYSIPD